MLRSTKYPRLGSKLGISFRSVNPVFTGVVIPTWYGTDTKGFSIGGASGPVATADKATFSSETTAAQTSANLTEGRAEQSSGGNDTQAYYIAGYNSTGNAQSSANKLTYSNDTNASNASAAFPATRTGANTAVYTTAIYSYGGSLNANDNSQTSAYKTTYSNDTSAAQSSANLATGRGIGATLSSDSAAMYLGGYRMTPSNFTRQTIVDKMPFSTETSANNTSLALPIARAASSYGSINGPLDTKGFVSGDGGATSWTKVTYSTDTSATMGTGYAAGFTGGSAGMSSKTTAYTLGGYTTTQVVTAYKMPFSSETVSTITAMNKSVAKSQSAGSS